MGNVDGGESASRAASVEFLNAIGTPKRDGLTFVHDTVLGYDLKKDSSIVASGKIVSDFHVLRVAMGADVVNST